MNTKNNSRKKASVQKIYSAFTELLQEKEIKNISVTEICTLTGLNRSTFYANFLDVYDLADKLREKLEQDFSETFADLRSNGTAGGALRMFTHIKENQLFYKTYFKLGYDEKHAILIYDENRAKSDFAGKNIHYHIEFFRAGLNALIQMWLDGGCKESPEEMAEILQAEYKGR